MRRFLRRIRSGALYDIKRLVRRGRRQQTDSQSCEWEYVPAFDPTLPKGTGSYGPRKSRRTSRTRER